VTNASVKGVLLSIVHIPHPPAARTRDTSTFSAAELYRVRSLATMADSEVAPPGSPVTIKASDGQRYIGIVRADRKSELIDGKRHFVVWFRGGTELFLQNTEYTYGTARDTEATEPPPRPK